MARQAKDAQNWLYGVRTRPWPTEFLCAPDRHGVPEGGTVLVTLRDQRSPEGSAHTAADMHASLGLPGIRQPRAEQGDLCSHAHGRHGCSMPVVPKRGRLASGRLTKRSGTGHQPWATGRPGLASGDRQADGGCQPFPARWIVRVGTFRLDAVESRDAAFRACRSHATVTTILPRVWPCSTVRRPSGVSARG
jgi:hypothetical protein